MFVRCKNNKMEFNPNARFGPALTPVKQLVISLAIVIIAGMAFFALFLYAGALIFRIDAGGFLLNTKAVYANNPLVIKYMIIAQDLSFFIFPAMIILVRFNPGYDSNIFSLNKLEPGQLLLVIMLVFLAFPVTAMAGRINETLNLPDWLSGLENWIRVKEDNAGDILSTLLKTHSFAVMCFNIFLIAVLPAVSEELIFRGVFQQIFVNLFRRGGAAVWVTAFIFSAIHLQFYGFLPRFLLGLIFGYLFLWSGNLWLPVLAHFVNNAVPAISSYTGRLDLLNVASGKISISNILIALICSVVILVVMNQLRLNLRNRNNEHDATDNE